MRTNGIYCRTIYANRSTEIASLTNFSLLTLMFIELRDFITGRVDETIYFVSNFKHNQLNLQRRESAGILIRIMQSATSAFPTRILIR